MITLRWLALLLFNGNSSCWRVLSVASNSKNEKKKYPKTLYKITKVWNFPKPKGAGWLKSTHQTCLQLFKIYDIFGCKLLFRKEKFRYFGFKI